MILALRLARQPDTRPTQVSLAELSRWADCASSAPLPRFDRQGSLGTPPCTFRTLHSYHLPPLPAPHPPRAIGAKMPRKEIEHDEHTSR